MSVRRRKDGAPDAWWVDFRVGGKRYRYTMHADDEAAALALEAERRAGVLKAHEIEASQPWRYDPEGRTAGRSHWKRLLDNARDRAKSGDLPFKLTKPDLDFLLGRAGGHCELTGLPFCWEWQPNARRRPFVPSLHRIRPGLGYVRDNLRIVCVAANVAVNEWGEDTFFKVAMAYVARNFKPEFSHFLDTEATNQVGANGHDA